MKLTIKTENGQKVVDLKNDLQFNTLKGEQYVFSNGFSNYILNFKDNQESVILTFNVDGKSIKVELNGIVPLLQANTASMTNPTAIIINKDTNDKDVNNIVENNNFNGGEIIDRLEALLSKPVELGNNVGSNLTLITDYQTLLESLGAAAAGGEATGGTSNGSTFNSIFSLDSGSLADIADTARWENLTESISNIPVETADTIATIVEDPINVNVKLIGINTEVIEGENATYKVTLTDDNGNAVIATENITVTFTYTYITASGEDISETISVVIPAGSSEAPVIVKTIDDNFAEEIESFTLELDSISNQTQFDTVSIDKTPVTTTITDETTPTDPDTQTAYVSIEGPTSVVEGNTTTPYTVSVTQAPTEDLTVTFTYTGKAIDGTDFTGVASVVIPKGEKSVTFDISTIDDNLAEGSENFTVTINSITNGGLEDVRVDSVKSSVTTTITDETTPTDPDTQTAYVSIEGPTSVVEGNTTTPYTVSVTQAPTEDLTVTFTYTGKAIDGTDFTGVASVVIPKGEKSVTFDISTIDDNLAEGSENFTVTINSITNGGLEDVRVDSVKSSVTTTITDETTPTDPDTQTAYVSIEGPTSVVEGNTTTPYTVSVTQAPTEDLTVTFTYTGKAIDGTDFTGVASVVIPKGEKSVTFDISTIDDNLAEGSENFTVTINSITNGGLEDVRVDSVKSSVTTTITDETTPTDPDTQTAYVSIEGPTSVVEGNTTTPYTVSVTQAPTEDLTVTFTYTGKAIDGTDFTGVASVVIPKGEKSVTFDISTIDDNLAEGSENFTVTINSITNGGLEDVRVDSVKSSVTTTITDETTPTDPDTQTAYVSIEGPTSVVEGNTTTPYTVSVTQAPTEDLTVTFTYTGKAIDGTDFTGVASVVIPKGEKSVTFDISTIDDNLAEGSENFTVTINSITNGGLEDVRVDSVKSSVTTTITDETTPTDPDTQTAYVSIEGPTSVVEGNTTTPYTVSVTQAPTEDLTVTFTYTGKAIDGTDFTGVASVVIPKGEKSVTFDISTIDDNLAEGSENFTVTINSITNGGLEDVRVDSVKSSVTTTITDETTPTDPDTQTAYVSIEGPTSVVEGNTTTPYTVSVTQAPTEDLTVTFTYTGKAIDGTDFTGVASVVIPKGEKSVTFDISTIDDNLAEGSENFTVTINSITNGGLEDVRVDSVKSSVTTTITDETTIITLIGSTVTEITDGTATGDKVKGIVTATIDKVQSEDLTIILNDNSIITIKAGKLTGSVEVETSRIDDVYKQGTTEEIISIASTSNSKINIENIEAIITIKDDIDPIDLTITATVTTPKIIDVTTATDGTTGVKITGFNSDGEEVNLSIITKTDHDGFGIEGKNLSNGDSKELGVGEKIVVEFTDGKDVNSLDISFAWRNNHETAKLTFIKDGQIVGYAEVTGDGSSTTKAIVTYYDENNNLIKTVNAKGSSDKVDEAFTFELPDSNGGIVSFDKVEFSAPTNIDDYLINKIVYKEVLDPSVTNIVTNGGDVTFNIQIDEDYPPQGSAKAIVSVNGIDYEVVLNATGRGTLTIDSADLGDLSKVNVIVKEIIGGNYEKVNLVEKDFDFTPIITIPTSSNDAISTDEDVAYILKVTDFGEVSGNTQEFKITQLPTNGKLFLTITIGDTIFNPDGTQTVATQNTKIEITKDQIISLAQIGAEKVEFVPNKNSDNDGSFNFQVGDGKGNFSNDYTTTINVVAVADAPTASIDITKVGATTISTGNNDNGNGGTSSSFDKLVKQTATGKDGNLEQDINQTNSNQDIEKDYQNVNANNIITGLGNDTLKFQALNNKTVTTGEGSDKVIIDNGSNNNMINVGNGNNEISITYSLNQGSITAGSGNDILFVGNAADGSIVDMGAGNDKVQIDGDFKSKVYLGAGDDKIALYSPHTNFEADGRSYIDGGSRFDTLYIENLNSNDFKVKIKSTGEEISWDKYSELNNHQNGEANIEFVIYHKINTNQGFVVKNIEQIVFSDKTISGETTTSAVEYKVDISAALKDTDGSETLGVVIKNVPTGAILESTKYDVSKNPDGSWSVNFKAGTTGNDLLEIKDSLTLKVPRSYKEKINLEIESKATESRDNSNGENFATAKDDASVITVTIEPFNAELDMDISEATIKVIETKDVNTLATSSAGIYEKDGKYYKTVVQSHTEKVLDTEALKNLQVTINGKTYTGITVGADGKYYVIDNTIAKEQKTIEVEREVTKTVELNSVDSFMIEVTKETKGIVLGKEVTDLGKNDTIAKNNFKTYTLEQPTSNIEIKLVSGSAKIEFVDANGKVIGSSITQTGTDSKGYSVPKDAVGVKITSTSNLKIDAIKYHVDPHEETVQVGGKILDIEGMQKAGISWNNTISEEKIQTQDITKLGSTVGDGNIKGFNPEAKANSQVFDFGKDKAYQLVTIKVDATISGSWNFNKDSTKDVFVVSANGVPQGAYNYTSSQDYNSKTPSQTTLSTDIATAKTNGYDLSYVNGTLNKTYEYEVYLDENGQVQMNFVVASTNTDEFVTVNNISVSYAGLSGFVQTKTEIEKVTETIFVGVPTNIEYKGEVPTKDIIKYENVEVETTPIYTKITQYEYVLDLSASITDTDGNGELSNIITLEDIPNGVTIKGYEANEDGTYTVEIGEDGKAQLTLISDSLLNDTDKESIKANITATDGTQFSDIKVNIDEKEESSQSTTFDGEGDIDLTSIIGQYKVNYIDLENGKANDIKLDFDEILADDKEIYIKGDDKDSISLNSDLWKEAEATNVDGVKYNVYTGTNSAANSTIKLLIDDDIQINHDI